MHILLFIVYFVLLCFIITRIRFFNSQLKKNWLLFFFGIHVLVGCAHNWIAFHFFPNHGDIWYFFNESVELKETFLTNPKLLLQLATSGGNAFNITDTSKPLLEIQYMALRCIHFVFNFLSFDNLYINTLLFSLPVFGGSMALFRFFYRFSGNALTALTTLLLPSILFWTSVLYKDGLFFLSAGYCCYYFTAPGRHHLRWLSVIIFIILMISGRANALTTLMPALLFLWLAERGGVSRKRSFTIVFFTAVIAVLAANILIPGGLLNAVTARHNDFQSLHGGSRLYLPAVSPNIGSFLAVLPVAMLNGFLQPLPGYGGKLMYTVLSTETIVIWLIVLTALAKLASSKKYAFTNVDIFCLLFAVPGMVIIGYIVPFAGAIIRYRSVYLPFLLAPFLNVYCSYPGNIFSNLNAWLKRFVLTT